MTNIIVTLPDGLGEVAFPEGTAPAVIEREVANAYLRATGSIKGRNDAKTYDQGLSQAVGGGVLQGFGDEATAAVRAAVPGFANWMMRGPSLKRDGDQPPQTVSEAPTYQGRYEEELARERAKRAEFSKGNPVAATTANVFGSIAPTVPLAMAGVPLAPAMGQSWVGNLGKAAITGGMYGALTGFGEGEGGFGERAKTAGIGAGVGAVAAPALMLAGQGVRGLVDWAKTTDTGQAVLGKARGAAEGVAGALDRLGSVKPKSLSAAATDGAPIPGDNPATYAADQIRASAPDPAAALRQRAAQAIATAVERGQITPQQALQRLAELGDDAIIADVSKSLMRTARMTNTLDGQTSDFAERVLDNRARQYNPRLRSAIEGPNPPPEDLYFRGDLPEYGGNIMDQFAREVGRRAYGDMRGAGLRQSPEMMKLLENKQIEGAMDRVLASLRAAREGTSRQPESAVEVMHMIKREIQNIGLDGNGRPSSTAYQWQQTANEFVDALKRANPALADADRLYARAKSLPDFYDAGLGVFDKGTTAAGKLDRTDAGIRNLLRAADVAQANATEFGAINAGRAVTGGVDADAIGLARKITQSEQVRNKIREVFRDRADDIFRAADTVMTFEKTRRGVTGGSQTADKLGDVFGSGAGLEALSVRATPGGIVPRFFEGAADVVKRVTAPTEPVRDEMGRMLFNIDPRANAETMALIEEILRQRAQQRQGAAVWGGLAGGYGGAAATRGNTP